MEKLNKKLSTILTALFITMLFTQCELNLNTKDDCLECSYTIDGRKVSEELCDAFGTEDDKDAMRDRLRQAADSLDVQLNCITH